MFFSRQPSKLKGFSKLSEKPHKSSYALTPSTVNTKWGSRLPDSVAYVINCCQKVIIREQNNQIGHKHNNPNSKTIYCMLCVQSNTFCSTF